MSKEEAVYVRNESGRDLIVSVSRDKEGDVFVLLHSSEEAITIRHDDVHPFVIPVGDD